MRKKLIAAVTAAVLLVSGLSAALASPGTSADPFITLSYLTGTFYPEMEQAMLAQAQKATVETEQEALERLSGLAGDYLTRAGGSEYSDVFIRLIMAGGDRLSLPSGASILFEAGQYTLDLTGELLDVTDGTVLTSGAVLTANHRYIVAENSSCTLAAVSDSVYLSVQGPYSWTSTGDPKTPFIDITGSDPYHDSVVYVYENGLFKGVSANRFSPSGSMTRAMVVTLLSRLAGVESVDAENRFNDVPAGSWYADGVNWAASVGIVNGVDASNNRFSPNSKITREQAMVIFYRYIQDYLGIPLTPSGDLSVFPDGNAVSSWAEPAVRWAVSAGLVTQADGELAAKRTATRAEIATMIQRFIAMLPET